MHMQAFVQLVTDIQTDRQTDRQTGRQTNKQQRLHLHILPSGGNELTRDGKKRSF